MDIREMLFAPEKRKIVEVDCGLEKPVRLRALTEAERIEFDCWLKNNSGDIVPGKLKNSRVKLIVLCVVGDDGEPILNDSDFDAIKNWPASRTAKLAAAAMKLCGLNDDDLDEAVKN